MLDRAHRTIACGIWSELESNQRPMDIRPLNNDESGRTVTPFEAGCRQGETELRDGTVLEKRKSQADLEISLSPEERKSAMEEWLKFNRSIREIRVRAKRASGTRQSVRNENPAAGTSDSEWAARLLRQVSLLAQLLERKVLIIILFSSKFDFEPGPPPEARENQEESDLEIGNCTYWSDSAIALWWIQMRGDGSRLSSFG
ncbi:hypothetical protein T4A_13424 [Trichinella pseudospiralis]|uniref:Uncharacterized protein n=1 Tax=Trichinella pseudospiralis TaxID=6337 RepID=A0A0V1EU68_TRIPS|nr:hypothetical protein T4A_13424 [Trichinella pseudospiralis]